MMMMRVMFSGGRALIVRTAASFAPVNHRGLGEYCLPSELVLAFLQIKKAVKMLVDKLHVLTLKCLRSWADLLLTTFWRVIFGLWGYFREEQSVKP